jgi:ferritin-like metal-binding protein YciE
MTIQSAQDLFFYDLCGMYDAELKLAQVLPTLAQESQDAQTRDAFLIGAGSKSEYLEISAYRGLIDSANLLGLQSCVPLFQQNLQQEEAAARKLATCAQRLGQEQVGRV